MWYTATMNADLEKILNQNNLRITRPRHVVFTALYSSAKPLQIGEIAKLCPSIDRVSVYRTIELFTQLHIIATIPLGWKQQYELAEPFKPHHHHIHCAQCGMLVDIHSSDLETLVSAIAARYNFAVQSHKFEISGLCQQCQKS